MQIAEKYQKDYIAGLREFKNERIRFKKALDKIPNIKVFDSQANYFMAEVNSIAASELVEKLLTKYNIFIKDLTSKINSPDKKQYIRIAIRNTEDNNLLVNALKDIIGD